MRALPIVGAALFAGLSATAASAMPAIPPSPDSGAGLVLPVHSWRYHNNCGWRDGRWVVDLGAGKFVVCRPNRPGRDYRWHREGQRHGWYDPRRRSWHNERW